MKHFWAILLAAPLFAASTVPNRYIVELSTESVSTHVARLAPRTHGRLPLNTLEANRHRARIRSEQATARTAIQAAEGQITSALENIQNALVVNIPDDKAARLSSLPGVRKVYPVRNFHLLLDHALALHQVPAAWSQVGIGNAGAGIRIAIIDTGIDIAHPGFQDGGFTAPDSFPRANTAGDFAYTNNKVIVARSYAAMFPHFDPDPSPADHVGHGTATAMAAAGVSNAGPLATISGVAPQAWLGSYKVFGTPGFNDGAAEDVLLAAIEDAVADGMDVISLSLGSDVAFRLGDDPEVQALENVAALGVIVVAAAGNNGNDPATISTPAIAPSVIAVGATQNDRRFSNLVVAPTGNLIATAGQGSSGQNPLTAPLLDVATWDGSGQACNPLPPNVLANAIALIYRGICTFETKLNNAQAAGATAALVYDNVDGESPIVMGVGAATLPAEMVSYQDGLSLKQQLAAPFAVTLQFIPGPIYSDPARLASFSAEGPNVDFSIKPDLVAVGANLYTAAEKLDPNGVVYSSDGYSVEQGTSFSTPLVAGAAALLKAGRPGLTAAQYRSLLINSASPASFVPGTAAHVQQAGAGFLNVLSSLNATAAVAPVSLSFGSGGSTINTTRILTVWNLGPTADTFQISTASLGGGPVPEVPSTTVPIDAGASVDIPVHFAASRLASGQYDGFLNIQGANSSITTRIPYWYAVASGTPTHLTILYNAGTSGVLPSGSPVSNGLLFRATDDSGIPVRLQPVVSVVSGGGTVAALTSVDTSVPGAYAVTVKLGAAPGPNVFRIQVGGLTKDVTIVGR